MGLGCLWAIVDEAHITLVGVEPSLQRHGLGQLLLYALLNSGHQRQLERATLEVRVSNQAALALYQKFGFREAGRRRAYYPDTGEDALILWRGGLQSPQFRQCLEDWQQEISTRLQRGNWQLIDKLWSGEVRVK